VRWVAVIGLIGLTALDGCAAVLGASLVEAVVHDPQRPLLVEFVRGLVAMVVVGGGPVLIALLALAAAAGVAADNRAAAWLGLGLGLVHAAVPGLGWAVIGACAALVREGAEP